MIRAARFIALVVGGATLAMAVAASSSSAADGNLVFNLPAAVYYEQDESAKSDVDPKRCQVVIFVEYPLITRAVSYEIVIRLRKTEEPRDAVRRTPLQRKIRVHSSVPPPKGFGRFNVGAYSTGEGCAAALGVTAGSVKIVSAKVSLDKVFEKRFRENLHAALPLVVATGKRSLNMKRVVR